MADSEESVPTLEEIQNMKVADLKKKLKAFGLSVTGNKTELMERLQEACLNKGLDSFESSQLSIDESQISPDGNAAIEENDMLDADSYNYSQVSLEYIGSSLEEDADILNDSENKLNLGSSSTTKPLKKRTISKTSEKVPASEKKVVLNRTNVALSEFNIKPVSDPKPVTVTNNKSETEDKKTLSVKSMSAAERLAMRAKRFNISNTAVTSNSKSLSVRNSKQSIISSASVAPDLEVLKKRAERFGQCVSTVMKQIEQKEKLLKRKCKFGANLSVSAASSLDEMEKKKMRAERFGVS